jgi:hypothetical protein
MKWIVAIIVLAVLITTLYFHSELSQILQAQMDSLLIHQPWGKPAADFGAGVLALIKGFVDGIGSLKTW